MSTMTGFAFPFRLTAETEPRRGIALASGPDKLRQNVVQLLLTDIGERVMRRSYGGGLRQLLHDPNNDALRAITQHQLSKAISQWEPHAQLQQVTVAQQPMEGLLWAEVTYVARPSLMPATVRVPLRMGEA